MTVKKRNRRHPSELLADLKAERAAIVSRYDRMLAKLDGRIARVEARYSDQLILKTFLTDLSPEDLEKKLEETKDQVRLLRKARKLAAKG